MESETILAELNKLNGRLDEIYDDIQSLKSDIVVLRTVQLAELPSVDNYLTLLNTNDKYKTWPLDSDLDEEEAKELEEARKNASEEWKSIKQIENAVKADKAINSNK